MGGSGRRGVGAASSLYTNPDGSSVLYAVTVDKNRRGSTEGDGYPPCGGGRVGTWRGIWVAGKTTGIRDYRYVTWSYCIWVHGEQNVKHLTGSPTTKGRERGNEEVVGRGSQAIHLGPGVANVPDSGIAHRETVDWTTDYLRASPWRGKIAVRSRGGCGVAPGPSLRNADT